MLSGRQIRAARALLDMSQEKLAQAAGLTPQAIRKIEDDAVQPRQSTMMDIARVFHERGVEFTDNNGVRMRDDTVTMIEGENSFARLLDDVIHSLANRDDAEALFACVIDGKSPPHVIENYRRLRRTGIAMRSLVKEGDTVLYGQLREYRCLPKQFFHNTASVIYGDKVANMILTTDGKDHSALVIHNPHVAAAQRNLFNFIWSVCPMPTLTTADIHYD